MLSIALIIKIITKLFVSLKKLPLIWLVVAIIFRQTFEHKIPDMKSLSILLCFWQMSALFLYAIFGGEVFKTITFPLKAKTIDTLEELAKAQSDGSIQVMVFKNGVNYESLKVSEIRVNQILICF